MSKEINYTRLWAGILYFMLGGVALAWWIFSNQLTFSSFISNKGFAAVWCSGWSAFGIGAGLINTRDHGNTSWDTNPLHYVMYYLFILFFISLVTFTIAFCISPALTTKFYLISASIAIIFGFLAEDFGLLAKQFLARVQ